MAKIRYCCVFVEKHRRRAVARLLRFFSSNFALSNFRSFPREACDLFRGLEFRLGGITRAYENFEIDFVSLIEKRFA